MADNHVTQKILKLIRNNMPDGCPKDFEKSLSGKSIRIATITEMLLARGLSYTDVTGRSGKTTLDTYKDKHNISRGLRSGMILAHWTPDADYKVPKLDTPSDAVYGMLDKLFTISHGRYRSVAFSNRNALHQFTSIRANLTFIPVLNCMNYVTGIVK